MLYRSRLETPAASVHGLVQEPPDGQFALADGLRVFPFDDDAVVFDPLSWDAHLLNTAAIAVLDLLRESPRTERDVVDFLQGALQPDEQQHATVHARRLLDELKALGLVQALGPTPIAYR